MFGRMRRAALGVLVALAVALATAGTAGAYTTDPAYSATDFVTGFANNGPNNVGPVGLAWDSTNHLYVMDYFNGLLYKFDASGGVADAAHQVTVGQSPWGRNNAAGIAFSQGGRLYVAVQGWHRVDEVDLANGQVARTIASASCATGIATDPTNGDLLVSDPCPGYSTRIHNPDGVSPTVSARQLPYWADGVTFAPDGTIWTTYYGNYLYHVDGTGAHYVTTIATLDGTAVSSAGDGSVFANTNNGRVVKYDPSTGTQTTIFSGGSRGDFSTVGPDGCLYITQTDRIVRITNADGTCSWSPTTALPTLTLAPNAQTHHVGETATVTATLANVSSPEGTTLDVTVTGANPQTTTATVGADGTATIDLTATNQGVDHVSVSTTIDSQPVSSNTADITWEAPLDATPPVITPTIDGTLGNDGWYVSPVTISFAVSDPETGIASSSDCETVSLPDDTASYSVTCSATNGAGLSNSDTETVKIDQTAPEVTWTGNAGTYDVDQTVAITCGSSDALSGVVSDTCANVSGPAWSFGPGDHTFSATATDDAGNVGSADTTFTVVVSAGGLCNLVEAWTSNAGVANSLCVKLAHGSYAAFRNEVSAQRGKKISADHADELIALSESL